MGRRFIGTIKQCVVCHVSIKVSPSKVGKVCSRKCMAKLQSQCFKGMGNPAYKGGTVVYGNYRYIRGKGGTKPLEHRVMMEQHLGRKLTSHEEVHHINGDTLDNRIENFWLLNKKEHSRIHFELFKKVQFLEQENARLKALVSDFSSVGESEPIHAQPLEGDWPDA